MARTTNDLIKELEEAAASPEVVGAAIVVGFENAGTFVFSRDADQQETLNEFVRQGGELLGIIRHD